MSEVQAFSPSNPITQPKLVALTPKEPLTTEDLVNQAIEKRLSQSGIPQPVAHDIAQVAEKAAKRVPNWVIWLILAFGGPLTAGIYAQYQTYKSLPDRVSTIETKLDAQGSDIKDIKVLLTPKPKE